MKVKQITETTTAGAVATVATPIGKPQKRAGSLFKGKKTNKPFFEGKMGELADDINNLNDAAFKKKYGMPKSYYTKTMKLGKPSSPVSEAEITEHDLILNPGQLIKKDKSFISHDNDRRDHEVQMARSDLYATAKNAMKIYQLLKDRSEDEGLMGWQQSYITLAADYLNSVAESIDYDNATNEGGGVIAGGMSNFEEASYGSDQTDKIWSFVVRKVSSNPDMDITDSLAPLFAKFGYETRNVLNRLAAKHGYRNFDDFLSDFQPVGESKQRLDPKCWTGYKKQGTKMKGGVRVNNCVKK